MRSATRDQRTVLQTHDPADGDHYVPVAKLEGVTLPLDSPIRLTIDGDRWHVVRRSVDVDTQTRTVITTVTVIRDGRGNPLLSEEAAKDVRAIWHRNTSSLRRSY